MPINDFKRSFIGFRKLPEIMADLRVIKSELNELKEKHQK